MDRFLSKTKTKLNDRISRLVLRERYVEYNLICNDSTYYEPLLFRSL